MNMPGAIFGGLVLGCALSLATSFINRAPTEHKPTPEILSIRFANNPAAIAMASDLLVEAENNGECVKGEILSGATPIWVHSCLKGER